MTRTMGRSLTFVFLACVASTAGFVVGVSPALACSCAQMDLARALPEADGAFVGTYVDRDPLHDGLAAWTFEVESVVKGPFGPRAVVRTIAGGAGCGIELLDGPRIGLLLDRAADGVWESGLCQQVSAGELLTFATDGHPPDPTIAQIEPGWSVEAKAIAAAALLVTALAVIWGIHRRRRVAPTVGEGGGA